MKVRRIGYALGAEITGVDATRPLDGETAAAIRAAWLEHVVVVLRDQELDPLQFRRFCASFGELDVENNQQHGRLDEAPEVVVRANQALVVSGRKVGRASAASTWHTDYSETARPAPLTFLLAKELPKIGGDTMFASLYRTYDALSPVYRRALEPLVGVHDVTMGQAYAGYDAEQKARCRALMPPVAHRLMQQHPDTGRNLVYVADRIRHFVGMTEEESRPIRDFFLEVATRYEHTYRHRWEASDLIIWDNRCALHNAVQDYDQSELRSMLRSGIVGPKTGRIDFAGSEAYAGAN